MQYPQYHLNIDPKHAYSIIMMKFIIASLVTLASTTTFAQAWQVCNICSGGYGIDDSPRIQ